MESSSFAGPPGCLCQFTWRASTTMSRHGPSGSPAHPLPVHTLVSTSTERTWVSHNAPVVLFLRMCPALQGFDSLRTPATSMLHATHRLPPTSDNLCVKLGSLVPVGFRVPLWFGGGGEFSPESGFGCRAGFLVGFRGRVRGCSTCSNPTHCHLYC